MKLIQLSKYWRLQLSSVNSFNIILSMSVIINKYNRAYDIKLILRY